MKSFAKILAPLFFAGIFYCLTPAAFAYEGKVIIPPENMPMASAFIQDPVKTTSAGTSTENKPAIEEKDKKEEEVKQVAPNQPTRPEKPSQRIRSGARPEVVRPGRAGRPEGAGRPQGVSRPGRN
jgi:hypothetical protein